MPGPQEGLSVGKQMSKRKVTRETAPQRWVDLMMELRRARIAAGYSTRDIADKFNTNVSLISKWEQARTTMHPHDLLAMLDLYGKELVIRDKEK